MPENGRDASARRKNDTGPSKWLRPCRSASREVVISPAVVSGDERHDGQPWRTRSLCCSVKSGYVARLRLAVRHRKTRTRCKSRNWRRKSLRWHPRSLRISATCRMYKAIIRKVVRMQEGAESPRNSIQVTANAVLPACVVVDDTFFDKSNGARICSKGVGP